MNIIFPDDSIVIAVGSDGVIDTGVLPLLDINQPEQIVTFIGA